MAGSAGVGPTVPQINIELDDLGVSDTLEVNDASSRTSTQSRSDAGALGGLNQLSVNGGTATRSRSSSIHRTEAGSIDTRQTLIKAVHKHDPKRGEALERSIKTIRATKNLVEQVPQIVRREREEHLKLVAAKLKTGELKLPAAFGGTVACGADGQLRCGNDAAVDAVMRLAHTLFPERAGAIAKSLPPAGVAVQLPLEPSAVVKAKAFDEGCTYLTRDSDGKEGSVKMTDFALSQAIKLGRAAFGSNARLNEQKQAQQFARRRAQSKSGEDSSVDQTEDLRGAFTHPFAFLKEVRYLPETDHPDLKSLLNDCMNSSHPMALEMRGQLGAAGIDRIINKKGLDRMTPIAIIASLIVAGGASYVLDELLWSKLARLAKAAGYDPVADIIEVFGKGSTGYVAEGLDSGILGRFFEAAEGKPMLWQSWDEFKEDLAGMHEAGKWSAVGQTIYNTAGKIPGWGGFAVQAATAATVVAPSSAALVPRVLRNKNREIAEGALAGYKSGMFAMPQLPEGADMENPAAALLAAALKETRPAVDRSKVGELSTSAMGKGPWWSAMSYFAVAIPARLKLLNDVWVAVASIAANTPTELYNVTLGTAKGMVTDHKQQQQIFKLIVDNAVQRMRTGETAVDITAEDLYDKEHPGNLATSTFRQGKALVDAMNSISASLAQRWAAFRKREHEEFAPELEFPSMPGAFPREP
ncbi:hypothetical protein GWC77_27100 [Paraburkholderia sp. NMBU_R16]|uniref:hypothetical protein n=1 Tax=Paraburkholderia sp. NMBU_R16 TaxID=2698676 RepID=UPI001564A5D0|nr:hypothetical protein [Paraburkholderia sp. NMBU_R16]NRO99539.1 hypothetical protein [Paraburkholderia sp. NMBU_R16]